jgi:hypothetical protein
MTAEPSRWSARRLLTGRVAAPWLAVAALLGAASVVAWQQLSLPSALEGEQQLKGQVDLLVYARNRERVTLLDRFNRGVQEGTEIRFILTGVPEQHTHVMIASVDAKGKASIYYPYQGSASAQLPGPGRWEVPGSIVLDGTLGPERVFALFSRRPLDAQVVQEELARAAAPGPNAIRDLTELKLPDTTQRSFLMFKLAQK